MASRVELYKQYIQVEEEMGNALKLDSVNEMSDAIATILEDNKEVCEPVYLVELILSAHKAGKVTGKEELKNRIANL